MCLFTFNQNHYFCPTLSKVVLLPTPILISVCSGLFTQKRKRENVASEKAMLWAEITFVSTTSTI